MTNIYITKQKAEEGIGFFGLLTIVFITLKLTGHITWSWLWVLGPIWIPVAIPLAFVLLIVLFVMFIVSIFLIIYAIGAMLSSSWFSKLRKKLNLSLDRLKYKKGNYE